MEKAKVDLAISEFNNDTHIVGEQTDRFLRLIYPGYLLDVNTSLDEHLEKDSSLLLDSMTYFRIARCTVENTEDLFESVNAKIVKLLTALHSINIPVAYGIVSRDGVTNLVFGVYYSADVPAVKSIISGILSGIELEDYFPKFAENARNSTSYGVLSGVPSVFVKEQKQTFSPSTIMRTLNGRDYTMLFLAKPVSSEIVKRQICELIELNDIAFAVSKRNIARNSSSTDSDTHTDTVSTSNSIGANAYGGVFIPPFAGGAGVNYSHSSSKGFSDSVSKAITEGKTIAADIQNGFALQLMSYATKAIERLKESQSGGVWQTAICYSADSELSRNIIKACLCSELSKPDPDKLSLLAFEPQTNYSVPQAMLIPAFLNKDNNLQNPLCSYINSSELGLLCTIPTESVPDFELRTAKSFPQIKSIAKNGVDFTIGNVTDGKRKLDNMPFGLSADDLNKHTFVCGITGSGKTTTVKRILVESKKPFMIIESAKKEYRNIPIKATVFTLGKPELNCPRINPFYIMPGVSPQSHIDYLKDLFIASFSFYGPMPYILEKCLHNVYKNKGWNLTLGFHPLLVNKENVVDFFDFEYMQKQYAKTAHSYLFPTTQELKDEIERYIKEEMDYEGEVAGNIKTAIKVRLDNLCVGAKGYMFNTYEHLDLKKLLEQNTVFELEGLADDSDKAFCVGLMVIFINEYRQTIKEARGGKKLELLHLLVIEEAHRLLKNVDTDRSSESMGNPKGKAVEHFTNMIAEMRSYGQGVIVAEQIPSKLAPDVIKNSSNKIVHRIVSADDQQIIANTIGISVDDAIQLGTLETGYALCHKEGMALPVSINVNDVVDDFVSDELLFNSDIRERLIKIDLCAMQEALFAEGTTKLTILALLNSIGVGTTETAVNSYKIVMDRFIKLLKQRGIEQTLVGSTDENVAIIVFNLLTGFLTKGLFSANKLPDNDFMCSLNNFLVAPSSNSANALKKQLAELYGQNVEHLFVKIIVELIKRVILTNTDVNASIREYFVEVSDNTISEITKLIKED